MNKTLVDIKNLTIEYRRDKTFLAAVKNVDLNIPHGRTVGLVGESGCGKSTLALALMGLLPEKESRISSGSIQYDGRNLAMLSLEELRQMRGRRISMIFQDPFSALNPVLTVGYQLRETEHPDLDALLAQVQLTDTKRILSSYPHQLSGGQRQRIMIAMALAGQPDLLIADEPTTALDVTVQAEIMVLLKNLQAQMKMSMLFITHNLGLVKQISEELAVMVRGKIVEFGPTEKVLSMPKDDYTKELIQAFPRFKKAV